MNTIIALGLLPILQAQTGGGGSLIMSLLPMIVIFAIFYLLLIRPQQKKARLAQQEREYMLSSLKGGDKVVTTGGIYGTIVSVRDDRVQLRIAEKVAIEVQRAAIAGPQSVEGKETEVVK